MNKVQSVLCPKCLVANYALTFRVTPFLVLKLTAAEQKWKPNVGHVVMEEFRILSNIFMHITLI